jgi:hypothetical protein
LKTFASVSVTAAALLLAAPQAPAQQVGVVVDAPGEVDPTSQGWVVYRGVPFPPWSGYFLLCQNPQQSGSGDLVPAGEVAEDVHMLQGGDLASVTFTYRVWSQSRGGSGPASGAATATLNVYANDATDTTLPSAATLLGTWTIPLTWEDDVWYVVSYDIPAPIAVPEDLWVGIEIDSPDGTAGGLGGKGALSTETGAIQLGESHNLSWLGVSACEPTARLVSNFDEFGIVGNYGIDVRVFPVVDCEFPVADGDFETGELGAWSALGRSGVVTAEQVSLATASGAWQAAVTNGDAGGDVYYGNPALPGLSGLPASAADLEAFLGLAGGTLSGLAGPNAAVEGSAIKQTLSVNAGDRLRFHWSFLTNEGSPAPDYNDLAFVSISTESTSLLADTLDPDLIDSLSVHAKETGYRTEEIELTTSGTVTVGFGVVDQGDAGADASLLVDCVELVPGPGGNQPPTCWVDLAAAAADFLQPSPGSFVVTEGETIVVGFEGSDPDGDLLMVEASGLPAGATLAPLSGDSPLTSTFSWTPTAADKSAAPYTLTVTFRDSSQASSSCGVTVEDVNLRPICSVADVTVDATGTSGAAVTLSGSVADADDPAESLVTTWFVAGDAVVLDDPSSLTPTGLFPVGSTDVTMCVVDGRGGWSECTATVTVLDAVAPEVVCSTDTSALWPPKHGMHAVTVVVSASQGQAQLPISVLVSSSEPDDADGNGDGQTSGDVHGQDGYSAPVDVTSSFSFDAQTGLWSGTVLLRAEREGTGVGRKYTIDVSAVDGAGGSASASCCVVVPHDRRKSSAP